MMRVFAAIFALALVSGCHGRSFLLGYEEILEDSGVEGLEDFLRALDSKGNELMKHIRSSEVSRELTTLMENTMDELIDMKAKLVPYTQQTAEHLGQDLELLAAKLRSHLVNAMDQVINYGKELQTMVEQNTDDIRVRVNAYIHKMKKRLSKDTRQMHMKVGTYLEEVQSRTADNMENMRMNIEPYFSQMRDNVEAKMTTLNQLLKKQAEQMWDGVQSVAMDVREEVASNTEDLRGSLEEKMEALRQWFEPYTTMIREKIPVL